MKYLSSTFSNQRGLSMMEVVIGAAIASGVALMVGKNIYTQRLMINKNQQSMAMESSAKGLADIFKKRSTCENSFGGLDVAQLASSGITLSPSELGQISRLAAQSIGRGTKLEQATLKLDGASGRVGLSVALNFQRTENRPGSDPLVKNFIREVKTEVFIKDGKIACENYGEDIFENALAKVCGQLGGDYDSATSKCSVNTADAALRERIGVAICESLNKDGDGALDASKHCSVINVQKTLEGQNLGPGRVVIGGNERNLFDAGLCENYMKGLAVKGDKVCSAVSFEAPAPLVDSLEPTCSDSSWSPLASTVCSGNSLTQTSNCGNTRSVAGTKNCCSDSSWSPSADTVCSGTSLAQTSNCGNTRTVAGTKDCSSPKGCTATSYSWSTRSSLKTCYCSENRSDTRELRDGESRMIVGYGRCGSEFDSSGSATMTCKNGVITLSNESCKAGALNI